MRGMDAVRTPEERFASLADFPYEPRFVTLADGLRVAYVEAGPADGPTVVLVHGEPTWSYLYRTMLPVLADAGLRALAPDLVGFGRSDKPTERSAYSYAGHVGWLREALFDVLDLREVTYLGQDWGGLLGLRLVAEHPDRFARVVMSNTGLPTRDVRMPEVWWRFREAVETAPRLDVGRLVAAGCRRGLSDQARAGYDAPFPDDRYLAGARAFPGLVPNSPDDPAAPAQRAAWEFLARFDRPFLCAFSDGDPITAGGDRWMRERIPGARGLEHVVIRDAGHFLQEDAGPELAEAVIRFVRATS
jgi:haloalkane dehalogenase